MCACWRLVISLSNDPTEMIRYPVYLSNCSHAGSACALSVHDHISSARPDRFIAKATVMIVSE